MDFKEKVQFDYEKYSSAFKQYGYSPKSLLWSKGGTDRRFIRYYELLKHFNLSAGQTLLDVGCGFADLYQFCNDYFGIQLNYTGVDYCKEFIETAQQKYSNQCTFIQGDFLSDHDLKTYDYCVTSGIFNLSDGHDDDVEGGFLYSVVKKMFVLCNTAISFNFVTNKVDYKNDGVSYYSPAKLLDFCYSLSRNIVFDNTCMPFEATVTVFKDDSFGKSRVFNSFERYHNQEFQGSIIASDK